MLEIDYLTDYALLLLRIIIAVIFFSSGKSHMQNPEKRGESIGMSANITFILGLVEVIGALSIALGIFTQMGAATIIVVMLGAIYKKIFEWKIGFYADEGYGWHYDLLILLASLVILTTAGGALIIY